MDEDHTASPAAPGSAPEQSTVRSARRSGRDGSAPSRPLRRSDGSAGAGGRSGAGGLWAAMECGGPVRILHVAGEPGHDSTAGLRGAPARPVEDGVERVVLDPGPLPGAAPDAPSAAEPSPESGRSSEEVSSARPGAPPGPV